MRSTLSWSAADMQSAMSWACGENDTQLLPTSRFCILRRHQKIHEKLPDAGGVRALALPLNRPRVCVSTTVLSKSTATSLIPELAMASARRRARLLISSDHTRKAAAPPPTPREAGLCPLEAGPSRERSRSQVQKLKLPAGPLGLHTRTRTQKYPCTTGTGY